MARNNPINCLSHMRTSRVFNLIFAIGFVAVASAGGISLFQNYQKLQAKRGSFEAAQARLDKLERDIQHKSEALSKLDSDPEYVERVIRQKLNYAKENEVVFRFE